MTRRWGSEFIDAREIYRETFAARAVLDAEYRRFLRGAPMTGRNPPGR